MTREQFNSRFAAKIDTTDGFNEAQIAEINDAVFERVKHLDADDANANLAESSELKHAFEREFAKY